MGPSDPNETETENENGAIEVKTCVDGSDKVDANGPNTHGIRPKMSRGAASHKTEAMDTRVDLFEKHGECKCKPWVQRYTHHLLASSVLIHRAVIFNRALTLVVDRRAYFSSSGTGSTLASHHGNWAGSVGRLPYAIRTRG